jgi:hypothetical protein
MVVVAPELVPLAPLVRPRLQAEWVAQESRPEHSRELPTVEAAAHTEKTLLQPPVRLLVEQVVADPVVAVQLPSLRT